MAVTLPVVLLLFDYYLERPFSWKVIFEKIPFFILSLLFGILAIMSQRAFGAIVDLPPFSLFERLLFVPYALLFYVVKLFVPINLSAMYYYPSKSAEGFLPVEYYLAPIEDVVLRIRLSEQKRLRSIDTFVTGPSKRRDLNGIVEISFPEIEAYQAVHLEFE